MRSALFPLALFSMLVVSAAPPASAQIQPLKLDGWYCAWDGNNLGAGPFYDFGSREDGKKLMHRICRSVGLEPNFEVREASVPNAVATIQNDVRLILYNPNFMNDIDRRTNAGDWGSMSVLAHEIGHHLQGHTIQRGGSRPDLELQADKFSGFSLAQLGATLEQACAAMKGAPNPGSATHPPSEARIVAITAGWKDAKDLGPKANDIAQKKPDNNPVPQDVLKPIIPNGANIPIPAPPAPQPNQFVARIVIRDSPYSYLITTTGQILRIAPGNQVSLYGVQAPPADPTRFAWDIQRPTDRMGVTPTGQVWGFPPNAPPAEIGYVTTAQ